MGQLRRASGLGFSRTRPERESEAVRRPGCSQRTAARAPGAGPGSGGARLLPAPPRARKRRAEVKCQTVTAAARPWETRPRPVRVSALLCLYSLSLNRINFRISKWVQMATTSPAPAPASRPLQEGLLPRWPRAGAAGGGHLARMLQDGGGPAPRRPHTAGTPWLSLVSQNTDAAPPSPGPALRLAPSRTLSGGPGRPARPLLGRRPASGRQVGTCPGAVACCLRGPHAHFL